MPLREKKGSKGGGGRVRLPDVDTGRLSGLKYKLICHHISGWELTVEIYNVIILTLSVTSNWGNFLTLKTIVLGEVSPILNSNR